MRYTIRTEEAGEVAKSYGLDYPVHVVCDRETGKVVPFGRYRKWGHAHARCARENNKEAKPNG